MGSNTSSSNLQQKYQFFQNYNDPNFGQCKILKAKQFPFEYVLLIQKYITYDKISIIEQGRKQLNQLKQNHIQSKFLRIIDFNIIKAFSCTHSSIQIYLQFLRHNLQDFLQWRKYQQKPLNYDEVVMALTKVIEAYDQVKNKQFINLSLKLQDIFLTTDGYIKFNPLSNKISTLISKNQSSNENQFNIKFRINQKRLYLSQNSSNLSLKSQINQKQIDFLNQIKKFVNQLVWDCQNYFFTMKNPEQSQFDEKRQIKRLLADVHKANSLKDLKKIMVKSSLASFYVGYQKQKHDQSQTRFSQLTTDFSQLSSFDNRNGVSRLVKKRLYSNQSNQQQI